MEIFALTQKRTGPCGHGEPGQEYLVLGAPLNKKNPFKLEKPYPVFTDRNKAQFFKTLHDKYDFLEITPLEVQ